MEHIGLIFQPFESSINCLTLKFNDPELEAAYIEGQISLKFLSAATKRFLLFILIGELSLNLLDVISAAGLNPNYTFALGIWIVYSLLPVVVILEVLFYFNTSLSIARGTPITVIGAFILFHNNYSMYKDETFYPYNGSEYICANICLYKLINICVYLFNIMLILNYSIIVWSSAIVYFHMHYAQNWKVTFAAYTLVFVEIMALICYFYGPRFIAEDPWNATIDFLYYIVIFLGYCVCALFAVWSYEITKRRSFYGICMQERETESWKKMMKDIPEPIIFMKKDDVIYYNKAIIDLFDIKEREFEMTKNLIWNNLEYLIMENDKPATLKDIMKDSKDGLTSETLFIYKTSNKSKRRFMIKSVSTNGVIEYIFHEVTAWRDLEKNKVKNQCFNILLATASHDIKTPLNVMLGVIDVLSDFANTPNGKEQIKVASSCGQRMLQYLKGLDFVRQINTSTIHPEMAKVSPSEVAMNVLKTMEFSANAKNISLNLNINAPMPTVINTDKDMYSIILQNLMDNAIKYTFTGGVTVTLTLDKENNTWSTTIADTGIGMNTEQLQNIGTLFKRSHAQTVMNPQGLGLGLFLVKTLVNQLDGEFSLESIVGKGTSARFVLKCDGLKNVPMRADAPMSNSRFKEKLSTSTMIEMSPKHPTCDCAKILLVDDEPSNLLVFSSYLSTIDMKADKAVNGKLALDRVMERATCCERCKGYSAIFMDINMPVMDGIESTIRINELIKEGKIPECKIVAVTAAAGLDKPEVYAEYTSKGFVELGKHY